MIKDELIKAGRYEDVKAILENIVANAQHSYAVNAFVDENGKTNWKVDGNLVREEAVKLLELIEQNRFANKNEHFSNLTEYVHSTSNIYLHNYAVSLSHRHRPRIDMDVIRSWEILDNLAFCIHDNEWDIPVGWARETSSYQHQESPNENYFEEMNDYLDNSMSI